MSEITFTTSDHMADNVTANGYNWAIDDILKVIRGEKG